MWPVVPVPGRTSLEGSTSVLGSVEAGRGQVRGRREREKKGGGGKPEMLGCVDSFLWAWKALGKNIPVA